MTRRFRSTNKKIIRCHYCLYFLFPFLHTGGVNSGGHCGAGRNEGNGIGGGNNGTGGRMSLPLPLTACHRCDVCGKLLSTKLTLKRHKEQQHLQPLNNAVCNLCHKVFRTLNSLNNHKSIYHRRQKHHHHHVGLHHSVASASTHLVVSSSSSSAINTTSQQHGNLLASPIDKPCLDFL